MQVQFDYTEYARQVRKVSMVLMSSGRRMAEISGRMHLLVTAMERDLIRFGEPTHKDRIACGPGCGTCCILNVSILFPEAIAITWYLQRRLSDHDLDELKCRLHQLRIKTRWLDDEERLFLREPCAFLDQQGSCIIHAVRPLLCRSVTSTDPSACREAITMIALDGAPHIEMNLFQKNLVDTVYRALAEALEELGLDHKPKRLTAAVLGLLSEPELLNCFLAKKPVRVH